MIHQIQLIWGGPEGQQLELTDDQLELYQLRKVFREEYELNKPQKFPNIDSSRHPYSLKGLFKIWTKHDPYPYCEKCLDSERQWLLQKQNDEEIREAKIDNDGWLRCPWCQFRFKYDPSVANGARHLRCGHRIRVKQLGLEVS